jgi:hypothetical protein
LRSLRHCLAKFAVKDFSYNKIKILTAKFVKQYRKGRREFSELAGKKLVWRGLPEVPGLWFEGEAGFFP